MDYTQRSLDIARSLASHGVPIFLGWPQGDDEFEFPKSWPNTIPDPSVLDDWQPGMAVCAVMGHTVDGLDIDTDKGGQVPQDLMPTSYGRQRTPSGGTHDLIAPQGTRSKDGILPGVDLKARNGMLFIAPTQRKGGRYEWEQPPNLDLLELVGDDGSGQGLAELVSAAPDRPSYSYTGPEYKDLPENLQGMADATLASKLDYWENLLDQAQYWPEGYTDHEGRGWFWLTNAFAWMLACQAATPWIPLDEKEAQRLFYQTLPEAMKANKKCTEHWNNGIVHKAASSDYLEAPPWTKFDVEELTDLDYPTNFTDGPLTEWIYKHGLKGRWVYTEEGGWYNWDGTHWAPRGNVHIIEAVRKLGVALLIKATTQGADKETLKSIVAMSSANRIKALAGLLQGVRAMSLAQMDTHADLLNVANGVIDLATGDLLPHDPKYYFTKISQVDYVPDAQHPDWDQVLTCLDPEVMDWMHYRFGQAITGHATSDDIMPIGQGDGANGKTTLISSIRTALGPFATTVPDRVLQQHTGVPTEVMVLRGARLALVDETPEAAYLDVQRLKSVLGSEEITARGLYRDPVSWKPTHSLMVMTNYEPSVRETDLGTWRRLALVRFDKTYKRDDNFRARMSRGAQGRSEAVLAWLVRGAVMWYQNNRYMPPLPAKVERDTMIWRGREDPVITYIEDRLQFDPNRAVLSSELLYDLNQWLEANRLKPWSANLMTTRFEKHSLLSEHKVLKSRRNAALLDLDLKYAQEPPASTVRVWEGLAWKHGGE